MTTVTESSGRNGVDTATLFATLDAVKGQHRDREVPVPRHHHVGQRDAQPVEVLRLLRRDAGDGARPRDRGRLRPPGRARGHDNGPTPVEYLLHGIAACLTSGIANIASARGVKLTQRLLDRRGRHQPARHPRAVGRQLGAQRLRADQGHLPHRRGRGRRDGARSGRAVPQAVCRVRRPHQPHVGRHRRGRADVLNPTPADIRTRPWTNPHDHRRHRRHRRGPRRPGRQQVARAAGRDHVVLDRGRVGERWRPERWDSLHLLTPSWMTRLPGWSYEARTPTGTSRPGASSTTSRRTPPRSVRPSTVRRWSRSALGRGGGIRRRDGPWDLARGQRRRRDRTARHAPRPRAGLPRDAVLTSSEYRNPDQLPDGGVLVVGASSSGVQIADELNRAGRKVVLAVGPPHPDAAPLPRGGHLLVAGDHRTARRTIDEMPDPVAARREPSLQLVGGNGPERSARPRPGRAPVARGAAGRTPHRACRPDGEFGDDLADHGPPPSGDAPLPRPVDAFVGAGRTGPRCGRGARAPRSDRRPRRPGSTCVPRASADRGRGRLPAAPPLAAAAGHRADGEHPPVPRRHRRHPASTPSASASSTVATPA